MSMILSAYMQDYQWNLEAIGSKVFPLDSARHGFYRRKKQSPDERPCFQRSSIFSFDIHWRP